MISPLVISTERRSELLKVFGVTAYWKRGDVAPKKHLQDQDTERGESREALNALRASPRSLHSVHQAASAVGSVDAPTPSTITETDTNIALKQRASAEPVSASETSSSRESAGAVLDGKKEARKFQLLSWRFGNLLVVETTDTSMPEISEIQTKTALVNNVLRAIFSSNFRPVNCHSQIWPDALMGGSVSEGAAQEWLQLFFDGQRASAPDTKLWLMGEQALDMILSSHGEPSELEGMRLRDSRLQMDAYVTPPLQALLEKPYLKAGVWSLLRELSLE